MISTKYIFIIFLTIALLAIPVSASDYRGYSNPHNLSQVFVQNRLVPLDPNVQTIVNPNMTYIAFVLSATLTDDQINAALVPAIANADKQEVMYQEFNPTTNFNMLYAQTVLDTYVQESAAGITDANRIVPSSLALKWFNWRESCIKTLLANQDNITWLNNPTWPTAPTPQL